MADKQKKENFFKRAGSSIAKGAKATKSEIKKISWPTWKQLRNNTAIVIACILVVGIVIFALDTVFGFGFNFFINRPDSRVEDPTDPTELYSDLVIDEPSEYVTFEGVTEPAE